MYEIVYKKEKTNSNANALSRSTEQEEMCVCHINRSTNETGKIQELTEEEKDKYCMNIMTHRWEHIRGWHEL